MHRSKLSGFLIDCQTDDLEKASAFWARALGMKAHPPDEDGKYAYLENKENIHVSVQKVSHPSRVHLDIATDNIEAEVARLEKLGAKIVERIKTWVVMEAPTGQRFCVVNSNNSPNFDSIANTWD